MQIHLIGAIFFFIIMMGLTFGLPYLYYTAKDKEYQKKG